MAEWIVFILKFPAKLSQFCSQNVIQIIIIIADITVATGKICTDRKNSASCNKYNGEIRSESFRLAKQAG